MALGADLVHHAMQRALCNRRQKEQLGRTSVAGDVRTARAATSPPIVEGERVPTLSEALARAGQASQLVAPVVVNTPNWSPLGAATAHVSAHRRRTLVRGIAPPAILR